MSDIELIDFKPSVSDFRQDVLDGLSKDQKVVPPKYLYDERGSQLFDEICHLEEYYPTRTETQILSDNAPLIEELLPSPCLVLEYGSGSSIKINKLLKDTSKIKSYIPLDISKEHLLASAEAIARQYPQLDIKAICADYTANDITDYKPDSSLARVVFFPGSTIGNLLPQEAEDLLLKTRKFIGDDGLLVLGFDLIKDADVLRKAYNDSKGVTAAFNLNLLTRMNRELGADFDVNSYRHEGRFNDSLKRMEMHLVSTKDQRVNVAGQEISFKENETIHTENSHKFRIQQFLELASNVNLQEAKIFTDSNEMFCVMVLKANSKS